MAFPERIRSWWLRVVGSGDASKAYCQIETYNEKRGFVPCGNTDRLQLHHLNPEAKAIQDGDDPDYVVGLVVCATHHIGRQRDEDNLPFTGQFTFHPDIGEAKQDYREGNSNAFKEAVDKHIDAAKRNERFWGGDEGSDAYYTQKQRDLAQKYAVEHPDDPKPHVNHREPRYRRKQHWYDRLFG